MTYFYVPFPKKGHITQCEHIKNKKFLATCTMAVHTRKAILSVSKVFPGISLLNLYTRHEPWTCMTGAI